MMHMYAENNAEHLETFCEFLSNTQYSDFTEETRSRAIDLIVDSIGVMAAGSTEKEADKLREILPSGTTATVISRDWPTSDDLAQVATANCIQMGFVELDEVVIPPGVHPAIHILPALLALGQKLKVPGTDFVTAFLLGYETTVRIHRATNFNKGIYPHGHTGTIGSLVAIGKLLNWDASQLFQAINIAASFPVATSYKSCLSGANVCTALAAPSVPLTFMAMNMVEAGFVGDSEAVGDTFGTLMGTSFAYEALTKDLGRSFSVLDAQFKFTPVCGRLYPVIAALSDAVEGSEVEDLRKIQGIKVTVDSGSSHLTSEAGLLPMSGKFSIPFSIAASLDQKTLDADTFSSAYMEDTVVRQLESMVSVDVLPSTSSVSGFFASVDVSTSDGVFSGEFHGPFEELIGEVSSEEVDAKFVTLVASILDKSSTYAFLARIRDLPNLDNINTVFEF